MDKTLPFVLNQEKKNTYSDEAQAQGHVVSSIYRTPELAAETKLQIEEFGFGITRANVLLYKKCLATCNKKL